MQAGMLHSDAVRLAAGPHMSKGGGGGGGHKGGEGGGGARGSGTSRVVGQGVGAGKGTDSKVGITCWSRPCRAEQLGIRKERGKVAIAWPIAELEEELV